MQQVHNMAFNIATALADKIITQHTNNHPNRLPNPPQDPPNDPPFPVGSVLNLPELPSSPPPSLPLQRTPIPHSPSSSSSPSGKEVVENDMGVGILDVERVAGNQQIQQIQSNANVSVGVGSADDNVREIERSERLEVAEAESEVISSVTQQVVEHVVNTAVQAAVNEVNLGNLAGKEQEKEQEQEVSEEMLQSWAAATSTSSSAPLAGEGSENRLETSAVASTDNNTVIKDFYQPEPEETPAATQEVQETQEDSEHPSTTSLKPEKEHQQQGSSEDDKQEQNDEVRDADQEHQEGSEESEKEEAGDLKAAVEQMLGMLGEVEAQLAEAQRFQAQQPNNASFQKHIQMLQMTQISVENEVKVLLQAGIFITLITLMITVNNPYAIYIYIPSGKTGDLHEAFQQHQVIREGLEAGIARANTTPDPSNPAGDTDDTAVSAVNSDENLQALSPVKSEPEPPLAHRVLYQPETLVDNRDSNYKKEDVKAYLKAKLDRDRVREQQETKASQVCLESP